MASTPAGSSSSSRKRRIARPWSLAGANGITKQDQIAPSPAGDTGTAASTPLPPPAVAFVPPGAGNKVRLHWEKLKRRVGNGSAPSDSLGDPTATTESDNGSTWRGAVRHGSVAAFDEHGEKKEEIVDEVVVDQSEDFECWRRTTIPSATASHHGAATGTSPGTGQIGTMQSDGSSLRHTAYEANGPVAAVVGFVRYRLWPVVMRFMAPSYHDPSVEESYQKEFWYNQKSSHVFGAMYFTVVWALVLGLLPRPLSTWNKVQLYGLQPALTVPMIPMAAFDVPRKWGVAWQLYLFACIWIFAAANPIDMHYCGFYSATPNCGRKDFQATLFYAAAMPTIALFALGQKRIYTVVYALSWIALMAATVVTDRPRYIRNLITVIIFLCFIIFLHYLREMNDRRVYTMRAELKVSYRAKQRAQINERKQLDAKRRFSSYIFHEVRVPLNTALLAVQNLKGLEVFDHNSEHAVEYDALESSLQLMSQVLNDVLDFSRMERGGFSSVQRPFSLHKVMQSIVIPLRLDAAARGLVLEPSFDKRVDEVAVKAAYPDEDISDVREGEGVVIGDEVRLRQIIGNLASNACKFTPPGGTIGLKTTLIYPVPGEHPLAGTGGSPSPTLPTSSDYADKSGETMVHSEKDGTTHVSLTPNKLQEHELKNSDPTKRMLVVRFEVSDTGVGIRPSDMAENRLFSPYVQTAVGREQGGKGTGLGLSLVRQIVMLMGGRLGVRSKVGEGSTLWVELAYPISTAAETPSDLASHQRFHRASVVSPGVASSAASDYRFVSSLRLQPSSITLDSFDEAARKRGLSVSTNTGATSPPGSPVAPATPTAAAESPVQTSPESSQSLALLPHRPEVRSTISSQSAPSGITLAPDMKSLPLLSSSVPVVSPTPILRPSGSSLAPTLPSSSASASQVPLTTPRPKTAPASKPAAAANKLAIDGPPLKVLVVDDDMLTRRLMSRMMLRLGCEVETAENGKIALDMILRPPPPGAAVHPAVRLEVVSEEVEPAPGVSFGDRDVDAAERGDGTIVKKVKKVGMDPTAGIDAFQHYDIVFLDNQMPVCSGVQVVAKLRSLGRDDLVVGVTANALQSDQEQYLESGASFILTKPVKEEDLVRHLRLADKRRTERADPTLRAQRQAKVNSSGPHFPPINSIIGPLEEDDD
ncbi:hypothetical protein JCM10908_000037 [Rhodotorula pacifica]|uniref:uncharacterized protein n=1 Tax=Rhodotorula pacifica TaxID=1495444 RepID=UPI003174D9E9